MLQLLISFFSGCVFITKQPSAILSTDKPDNFSYVRSQTEGSHQPANEFDIVPSKTPCWLQSPKNCEEYKTVSDIYIPVHIEISCAKDKISTEQIFIIYEELFKKYLDLLQKEIIKEIHNSVYECRGEKKSICEGFLSEYFIVIETELLDIKDKFEFVNTYKSEQLYNNFCEYYVLGLLTYKKHQLLKQKIIKHVKNNLRPPFNTTEDPDIKWFK